MIYIMEILYFYLFSLMHTLLSEIDTSYINKWLNQPKFFHIVVFSLSQECLIKASIN